ncbi:MAG TPA: carbohydrate ABC transporter permease [Spirochaetia bacterium]|nr:carbohydrate ABC transporter permease [Spirochaetia bacterium]
MKASRHIRFEIIAIVLALYFLLPFYWLAQSTTKDIGQLMAGTFVPAFPSHFIDNLVGVFTYRGGVFLRWLANSFLYAGVGSLAGTFFAAMAGFAFRRYRFFGRKILFFLILGFALVPGFATTLPLFIEFKTFHFLNTGLSIIVPAILNVFGVYLMVVYWNQVPEEMFDAAMIDGTREPSIFLRIGLPTIMPGVTTVLLLSFVAIWNNYFLALIMLNRDEAFPLILGITTISSASGWPVYNLTVMGAFLTALPLLILFLTLQRFLAPQLTGAIK